MGGGGGIPSSQGCWPELRRGLHLEPPAGTGCPGKARGEAQRSVSLTVLVLAVDVSPVRQQHTQTFCQAFGGRQMKPARDKAEREKDEGSRRRGCANLSKRCMPRSVTPKPIPEAGRETPRLTF